MEFDKGLLRPVSERIQENEENIDILRKAFYLIRNNEVREKIKVEINYLQQINQLLKELKETEDECK